MLENNPYLEAELSEEFGRVQDKGRVYSSPTEHIHTNDKNLGIAIETAKGYLSRDHSLNQQ